MIGLRRLESRADKTVDQLDPIRIRILDKTNQRPALAHTVGVAIANINCEVAALDNGHRPHRALNLAPPDQAQPTLAVASSARGADITRRDRLGGLIHEYSLAA